MAYWKTELVLFFLGGGGGGDRLWWQSLMCVWSCGWSVCVCVVSDVLYSARSFCLANLNSLWPDYCLSLHPPLFHTHSPPDSLLPLPLSSLSLYSSLCGDDSVIQMERRRKRAGCGAAMSACRRALYHKPLEKVMPSDGITWFSKKYILGCNHQINSHNTNKWLYEYLTLVHPHCICWAQQKIFGRMFFFQWRRMSGIKIQIWKTNKQNYNHNSTDNLPLQNMTDCI